jgi:hypothetical protein
MKVPSRLWRSASRTVDSISSSVAAASPTCNEEAPRPLPWPTSTTGIRAASAASA